MEVDRITADIHQIRLNAPGKAEGAVLPSWPDQALQNKMSEVKKTLTPEQYDKWLSWVFGSITG